MRKRASSHRGANTSTVGVAGATVSWTVDIAMVVLCWVMVSVIVRVGSWTAVTPSSPWTTVEVEMMDVVDVYCDVNGKMTVNSPDGEPDAIFLVAVRTNVEVLVTIVVQSGVGDAIVVAGGRPTELVEGDTRHLQAEVTNSES
jgi:hypothetical protein